jgi:hypothetical protein
MNGYKIAHFLSMDPWTSTVFKGFGMRDSEQLPGLLDTFRPALYVLNTDVESGKGEHWCVVFFARRGVCEFFDPFGFSPEVYGFKPLLTFYSSYIEYSNICVQSVMSKACAYHCLFFAYHRCRKPDMQSTLSLYDFVDIDFNEELVTDFVTQFGTIYKLDV